MTCSPSHLEIYLTRREKSQTNHHEIDRYPNIYNRRICMLQPIYVN